MVCGSAQTQCESLWAWHLCTCASLSCVSGDDSFRPQALVLLLLLFEESQEVSISSVQGMAVQDLINISVSDVSVGGHTWPGPCRYESVWKH